MKLTERGHFNQPVTAIGAKLTRRELGEALLALGIVAATGTRAGTHGRAGAQTSRVLARARRAMATGGAPPVRALVLRGSILTGFNAATAKLLEPPADLEIRLLLPDHYLNLQTRDSRQLNTGIRGEAGFFGGAGSVRPVPPETAAELRADVARLLLGVLAETAGPMPVTLADVDEQRARLSSRADPTFGGMITLASNTGLPTRLTYNAPVRYPERPITAEERAAGLGAPWKEHVAEVSLDFDDFRSVSGRRFPHLIRKSAADRTLQEITVSNIQFNPRLTRADFIPR